MSSETETPDSTCSTADASVAQNTENAPASEETTVIVNLLETGLAAPSSTTSTVEGDSASAAAAANLTAVGNKYPKLNASFYFLFDKYSCLTDLVTRSSVFSSSG